MGSTTGKLAVSALIFDYVLTGPISAVTAGQYIHGLIHTVFDRLGMTFDFPPNVFACGFALLVTGYFWWLNIKGIEESSDKALKIMQITTVMVVILIVWSLITIAVRQRYHLYGGVSMPPLRPQ